MNNNRTLVKLLAMGAIAVSLFTGSANADSLTHHVALQGFSYHFEKANERRGFHPGLGYEYSPSDSFGFQGGTFLDSFGYKAFYAGINYPVLGFTVFGKQSRMILAGNVMHKIFTKGGKPDTRFVPMPIIETQLYENFRMNITGSPELDYYDGKHTNGVLFVQFKLGLK